jgi:uncharacterized protein YegP (UPF0339 family)
LCMQGGPRVRTPTQAGEDYAPKLSGSTLYGGTSMAGKFELYKDKSGEFRFRLKAGNGEVIATSGESYTTKASALNGIDSIKRNAGEANIDDQTD